MDLKNIEFKKSLVNHISHNEQTLFLVNDKCDQPFSESVLTY